MMIPGSNLVSAYQSTQPILRNVKDEVNHLISSFKSGGLLDAADEKTVAIINAHIYNAITFYKMNGSAKEKFTLLLPNGSEKDFEILIGKSGCVLVRSIFAGTEYPDEVFRHSFASTLPYLQDTSKVYEVTKYPSEKLIQILKSRIPDCDKILPISISPTLAENQNLIFAYCTRKNGQPPFTCKIEAERENLEPIINIYVLPENDMEWTQSACLIAKVKGIAFQEFQSSERSRFDDSLHANSLGEFAAKDFILGTEVLIISVEPDELMSKFLQQIPVAS